MEQSKSARVLVVKPNGLIEEMDRCQAESRTARKYGLEILADVPEAQAAQMDTTTAEVSAPEAEPAQVPEPEQVESPEAVARAAEEAEAQEAMAQEAQAAAEKEASDLAEARAKAEAKHATRKRSKK